MKLKFQLLKKHSIDIYKLVIIFSFFFYFLLMGAAGHGFNFNSKDKFYLIFMLSGIFIIPINKNITRNNIIKNLYLVFSLITTIGTILIGVLVFKFMIEFKYGDDVSILFITLSYLLPVFFIAINGLVISRIINQFKF